MTIDLDGYRRTRCETIGCTTSQWNFPHDRANPWAKDGICSICGQSVDMIRVGPDNPNLYSHISVPHTRELVWYEIDADELSALLQYREDW